MQNFRALGAPLPEPKPPAAGCFAPKPPAAGGSAPRPPKQPPHCEFLATRLPVQIYIPGSNYTLYFFVCLLR